MKISEETFRRLTAAKGDFTIAAFADLLVEVGIARKGTATELAVALMGSRTEEAFRRQLTNLLVEVDTPVLDKKIKIPAEVAKRVIALAITGAKIQAIKEIKTETGMGLKESKDIFELLTPDASNIKDVFEIEGDLDDIEKVLTLAESDLVKKWKDEAERARDEAARFRNEVNVLDQEIRELRGKNEALENMVERMETEAQISETRTEELSHLMVSRFRGVVDCEEVDLSFGNRLVAMTDVIDIIRKGSK